MMRPCLSCGALTKGTRCPGCVRAWDARRRPSPWRSGYNTAHIKARKALAAMLPASCGYGCGAWCGLAKGDWVAAHVVDGDPDAGWIVSCPTCNQRAKVRA